MMLQPFSLLLYDHSIDRARVACGRGALYMMSATCGTVTVKMLKRGEDARLSVATGADDVYRHLELVYGFVML